MSMPLDTDFIRFSREMKPTKQCKISQKNLQSDQKGGAVAQPSPLKTPLSVSFAVSIYGKARANYVNPTGVVWKLKMQNRSEMTT